MLSLPLFVVLHTGQNCRKETLQLLSENLSRKNGGRSEGWVTDNERRDICEVGTGKLATGRVRVTVVTNTLHNASHEAMSRGSSMKADCNHHQLPSHTRARSPLYVCSVPTRVPLRYCDTGPGYGDISLIYLSCSMVFIH